MRRQERGPALARVEPEHPDSSRNRGSCDMRAVMIVVQLKTDVAWPWFTLIGATVTLLVVRLARAVVPDEKPRTEPGQ